MTWKPFRRSERVPLWLPPAILGALALGLCAYLAAGDASFLDLRPLMYIAIAVLWAGASSAWFVLSGLVRAQRSRRALEADDREADDREAVDEVARAAALPSLWGATPATPAAATRSRASPFGWLGLYLILSFTLFFALPMIDRGVAAQQVDGDTMRTVHCFEVAAVLNLLAASFAFARARRRF